MVRPNLPPEKLRSKTIQLFVSAAEHDAINEAAAARGMPMAAYLRDLGLNRRRLNGTAMDLLEIAERLERLLDKFRQDDPLIEDLVAIVHAIDEAARRR